MSKHTDMKKDLIVCDRFEDAIEVDKMNNYLIHILCYQGKGVLSISNKNYSFSEDDIVIILPELKVNDLMFSPDFKAKFLFLSRDILQRNNPNIQWGNRGFLYSFNNPIFHFSERQKVVFLGWCDSFEERQRDTDHIFYAEVLGSLIQTFLYDMWNVFAVELEKRALSSEKGDLFERYIELVRIQCKEQREVAYYADRLCVSAKYLSEVCKKKSGKTALEWIQDFVLQEIVQYLRNPAYRLSEIATIMHFSEMSFFSRYVRRLLGVSPSEYRRNTVDTTQTDSDNIS